MTRSDRTLVRPGIESKRQIAEDIRSVNRLIKAAHRRLFRGADAATSGTYPPRGSTEVPGELGPDEYRQAIHRIREIVIEKLPPEARVLVVSRGDEELARFENRVAWHFPRAEDGKYAGHHPDDSEEAVEHLQELQDDGAQYLLIPAPSFWWLDYYPGLFQYLAQRATMVWDDEFCLIFALESAAGEAGESPPPAIVRPLNRLLEALLPKGARVAVLSSGDSRLLAVEGRRALHFPQGSGGRYSHEVDAVQALEQLAELRSKGIEFLVVPHLSPSWLDGHPHFLGRVAERYGTIARREGVCTVFDLSGHADTPGPASRPRDVAATGLKRRRASREAMLKTEQASASGETGESLLARPLTRMLEALLPTGTRVAVLSSGDSRLLALEGRVALHFPQGLGGRYSRELDAAQAMQQLTELRSKGVEFLAIPHVAPSWLDNHPDFLEQVEGHYPVIARRESVCTVYELSGDAKRGRDV